MKNKSHTHQKSRTRHHPTPSAIKTGNEHNYTITLNLQENKATKCKARRPQDHCTQDLSTHHSQLPKVLLPCAFGG
jgi:hypothetical protein